jgi:putative spermidine/putrescine transport system ATP-binding protein
MLRLVKLDAHADRLPRQLSGGQQQRVALARALAIHPRLLLLDEPLSNLDASLRQDMAREIRVLQQHGDITTIMVTHDQQEAMALGDRLVVMRDGRVQQIGTPEDLHLRPANRFVASFIGGSNILTGELEAARLRLPDNETTISLAALYRRTTGATLALRPDSIRLAEPSALPAQAIGEVELSTYLGSTIEHVVRIGRDQTILARGAAVGHDAAPRLAVGSKVALHWTTADERLFDSEDRAVPAEPALSVVPRESDHV